MKYDDIITEALKDESSNIHWDTSVAENDHYKIFIENNTKEKVIWCKLTFKNKKKNEEIGDLWLYESYKKGDVFESAKRMVGKVNCILRGHNKPIDVLLGNLKLRLSYHLKFNWESEEKSWKERKEGTAIKNYYTLNQI